MEDSINNILVQILDFLRLGGSHMWIYQSFLIILLTSFVSFGVKKLFDHLSEMAKKTRTFWDDLLISSARKPARVFIWINGMLWAADVVRQVSNEPIFAVIDPVREVSFIVIFAWFLTQFISRGEKTVQNPKNIDKPMDATTASALGKLLRLSVLITTGLVVLQSLGFSVSGVLAFGGIGGIAVGFAARDVLANFFGGLMLYLDQPFKVGDWVRSPDKEIEGTVENIGWRLTCIRTFDKRPLYVPNATFASISVENPSRMSHRRILEHVGVRYADGNKVGTIVREVKEMLRSHPDIAADQTMIVNVNRFAASSIDFMVYVFTKTTNWIEFHEIKEDVMLKIMEIIEGNGAEIAFPTQTIHLAAEPNPEPEQLKEQLE